MTNYRDRLRRLAVNEPQQLHDALAPPSELDARTLAIPVGVGSVVGTVAPGGASVGRCPI